MLTFLDIYILSKVGQLLFNAAFIVGVWIAYRHWRQVRINRDHDNYSASINKVAEHNWHVISSDIRKYVVDIFWGLAVPAPERVSDRDLYWETRAVHLSHILLLEYLWFVEDRPQEFRGDHANWQRIALAVVFHLSNKMPGERPVQYVNASADLWAGLMNYEPMCSPEFTSWLLSLASKPIPASLLPSVKKELVR